MKREMIIAVIVIGASLSFARAQTAADKPAAPAAPAPPRQNRPAPIVSPEVHPDRTVTFRLRAPDAKKVTVSGEWPGGNKELTKGDNGVWSVTIGPLEPDLYGYGFSVDGFRTLDPSNSAVKPMRSPTTSILEIPGEPARPWEFTDVPHGTVRIHWYQSKSLGKKRSLRVYTPPDYDAKASDRYPVLYLFHGAGDNDATWTELGRAQLITDNLLAGGKAKPMVIVMTDGHAAFAQPSGDRNANANAFQADLLGDVIPFVESHYRTINDAQHRAIIGLSMGGGQSLSIGLNHPELFAYVGGMSSAVFNPQQTLASALADGNKTNERYKLLWIGCGKDDFLINANRQFSELLKEKGIKHEFVISEGNHSWPVWRKYLVQFEPLLFN